MTLLIELAGIAILLLWIVIPYQEFGRIFRRLRAADARDAATQPTDRNAAPREDERA
jgi:hypothetical protein